MAILDKREEVQFWISVKIANDNSHKPLWSEKHCVKHVTCLAHSVLHIQGGRCCYDLHFIDEDIEKLSNLSEVIQDFKFHLVCLLSPVTPRVPWESQWQVFAAWLVSQGCPEGWCSPGVALTGKLLSPQWNVGTF